MSDFRTYLAEREGPLPTEDILAAYLPLLLQVVETHELGMVAPLDGIAHLQVDGHRIWFPEAARAEMRSDARVTGMRAPRAHRGVEVVGEIRHDHDLTEGRQELRDLRVASSATVDAADVTGPMYLPGFRSYEHVLGHHDPATDTFVLGLVLASLALGLDLAEFEDLERFAGCRDNLFKLNAELHPVLAKVITQMTELDRTRRPQDLPSLAKSLADYREQEFDIDFDLQREQGFKTRDLDGRHQIILAKLQQRLFEISRRNRLLHYRETQQTVNLTHASVPLTFDPKNIRPEQILTWSGDFAKAVVGRKKIPLNRYLNFEEALYLPSLLNKIRAEARKDQAEFGFSNLRLVLCFLRWSNLKEGKERFHSPLLLLPVKMTRQKGVRDAHVIEPLASEAEVNPVLRFYFRELYGLKLPEFVDLEQADVLDLHRVLAEQIRTSEPAVSLELVDKPRITLIHRRARQRLDKFEKRSRLARQGTRTYPELDYSYAKDDFRPLGLQLFRQKVQPAKSSLESILDPRTQRHTHGVAPEAEGPSENVREVEQQFYSLQEDKENAYRWEFDLCSVTLGNFKYRKMSLVRDYEALLAELPENAAFDAVFSLTPPPTGALPELSTSLRERFPVVPCDPTQSRAIAYASAGDSYIIQGPPGTGKSQTITNLIADYVARGKRVLFVCEKRAAIDVVYHRLEQQGLAAVCSLVHDAQADKKELIADLRATYESFTEDAEGVPEEPRESVLDQLGQDLAPLADSHAAMTEARPELAGPLGPALARAVVLREHRQELSVVEREQLPDYEAWEQNRNGLARLFAAVRDAEPSGIYGRHPLRLLRADLVAREQIATVVTEHVSAGAAALARVIQSIEGRMLPTECLVDLDAVRRAQEFALSISSLAAAGKLAVLVASSAAAKELREELDVRRARSEAVAAADGNADGWRESLPESEVEVALAQARGFEGSFLSFLKPAWWRLRKVMRRCFDFDRAVVRPTWTQALTALQQRYRVVAELTEIDSRLRAEYGVEGELTDFAADLALWQGTELGEVERMFRDHVVERGDAEAVAAVASIGSDLEEVSAQLDVVLHDYAGIVPSSLQAELERVLQSLDSLPEFTHCLTELQRLPEALAAAIRTRPWTDLQLESALLESTLAEEIRGDRRLQRFDGRVRDRAVGRLESAYDSWLATNADAVLAQVRERFLADHRLLGLSASQMDEDEKARKKVFNKGLKVLQNEFKKTMRYKSIRELSDGESGVVLAQLKPVWLMSPLSVSDTLEMSTEGFDVVIFDEASQITLEEAVPAIFRAEQIIVVGDEMQLPPTDFFSARSRPSEEEEDVEAAPEYDLESNSFLSHATRNLRSSMLGWHYRSRSESLISFSNAAFYEGELLTVPEERFASQARDELVVGEDASIPECVDAVLDRPLSFHLCVDAVYESRRNRAEADYIAKLVHDLLGRETGLSIGIVAFSQAQQGEIEDALERLGKADSAFRDRLEAEYEREENGQFVGLLVKNLENIQGDERDIVIMSVCYGPDRRGKMRMNFGPINMSGGEKRLNVAFSRSKQHMVLVASVRSTAITNDYNVGANCLKNYLHYAELTSRGDAIGAARVLAQLQAGSSVRTEEDEPVHPVAAALADALQADGYGVDFRVGQSSFRCSLAVRAEGQSRYELAILIDDADYYRESDPLERDMMKPRLLRAFGWRVTHVLSKDWHADPEGELERIRGLLRG